MRSALTLREQSSAVCGQRHTAATPAWRWGVTGRSEFAASVYAAVRARDRGASRTLSAPDIVVGTTVEAYRGPQAPLAS